MTQESRSNPITAISAWCSMCDCRTDHDTSKHLNEAAIQPQDGMTVGTLIARLAAVGDFDAVVQFTREDEAFYVATQVNQYGDGGVVVGIVNPWDDGSYQEERE